MIVEPEPQYRALSEADVLTALEDFDPENPVAQEVARLIAGYTENFRRHVAQRGSMPEAILRIKPRWPIEAVAMRLTTETIRETVAAALEK